MTRLSPIALDDLDAETRAMIENAEDLMGFVPNDALVMARNPALTRAMWGLVAAVYGPGKVDNGLKRLVGEAASKAAGCFYCTAHAAHGAREQGVALEKIDAVWSFEDSPLFTEAERAAINLAMKAGVVPNETEDADFDRLRTHFSEDEIVEIVAVISMFGFLNRWNSTLDTALEPVPLASVEGME
ncbi:MAG: carboxymuconolactone decarboxylase family protein [Alphaproteobacteria bacterium]|nr:carboxymuconolactone decarboxylase family protein [Alphaproteobacteria bacterium]